MNNKVFQLIIFLFFVTSCNKSTPAGFWKNYKNKFILNNNSNQGPYGGYRAMHWKANQINTFSVNDVLDYANKNGWKLLDSLRFNQSQTDKWVYDNKAVFPLTSQGFSESIINNSELNNFPRWFDGDLKVFVFKTGWLLFQPGTDESTEENGFIVLNKKKYRNGNLSLLGRIKKLFLLFLLLFL